MFEENLQAMTELAQKHDIKVILCSVPPVHDYSPSKRTPRRPLADFVTLNGWMKQFVNKSGVGFADYYSALVDTQGMLKEACRGMGYTSQRQRLCGDGVGCGGCNRKRIEITQRPFEQTDRNATRVAPAM